MLWRLSGVMALLLIANAKASGEFWTFQPPVTGIAQQIESLHSWLMLLILLIFVLVFGFMFYAILRHRKSLGHVAKPFHENTLVEILWTLIPALILLGMAWPAASVILAQKNTHDADFTIKATGHQWYWAYDYLDHGFGFKSKLATPRGQIENYQSQGEAKNPQYLLEVDQPLVVPVGKKIRILTTSNDVIHSWGVPAFGVKQDAIPGFIRDTWFKADKIGTYRGQCVELCGKDHGFMPIVVNVVSQADFDRWLAQQQARAKAARDDPNKVWTRDELLQRGKQAYEANCAACHKADGAGSGAFPALAGSKIANGAKAEHIRIVLNGKNAMPSWGTLSDVELAAAISYERTAWGNQADLVMPAEIRAARAKGK
ncbi:cytochrome c oxidase subunit II [Deefgea piscis]|uniref:Cytochrome c oxidase subunit 2 n=1 Tax=Deefgea piscis TaxID=2739061 RepID=A0A6M8SRI2_9NEIS|nr:cytochrome c oxidase subunit II [Deefgea piscis]QKJ66100.1 cytochrome c oxidase subunit II [Deefgea piscis]